MNYNCDKIELSRKPVVWSVLQSWINGSVFQPSHFEACWAFAWFTVKMPHLLFEKYVHIYTTQSTTRQSEANWSRWPLLNHITGDHISLFIGHKRSTSVSTWLSFHTKHLNRDSSPISVVPLCLFKPACVSYIQPPRVFFLFRARKCNFWKDSITEHSVERTTILPCLHRNTVCFKRFVYIVWSFNTQLIWQLCKPETYVPMLDLAFFLIWSQSPSCVWLLFNCFLSAGSIISPGPFVGGTDYSSVFQRPD